MNYYVGIDETGSFELDNKSSRVGGVVFSAKTGDLNQDELLTLDNVAQYLEAAGSVVAPDPRSRRALLKSRDRHTNAYALGSASDSSAKQAIVDLLNTLAAQTHLVALFKSAGKPFMQANNQHWWLCAQQSCMAGILAQKGVFARGDKVTFLVDGRSIKVTGAFKQTENGCDAVTYQAYNNYLQSRLAAFAHQVAAPLGIATTVLVRSDDQCAFIGLADLALSAMGLPGVSLQADCFVYPCVEHFPLGAAQLLEKQEYRLALSALMQQGLTTDGTLQSDLLDKSLKQISTGEAILFWTEVIEHVQLMLDGRGENPDQVVNVVPNLLKGLIAALDTHTRSDQHLCRLYIRLLRQYITLDSHLGTTAMDSVERFRAGFTSHCSVLTSRSERWETWVKAETAIAQLQFNAYNFAPPLETMLDLWALHDKGNEIEPPGCTGAVDDLTAELTGTIGQAQAFAGDYKDARRYLEIDYAATQTGTRYRSMVNSYLISVALRLGDFAGACSYLGENFGFTPNASLPQPGTVSDNWLLLDLMRIHGYAVAHQVPDWVTPDLTDLHIAPQGYPVPLVLKWQGFLLANQGQIDQAEALLRSAARVLMDKQREFAIRTLAIPCLLMLVLINPGRLGTIANKYDPWLEGLMNESPWFKEFMKTRGQDFADLRTCKLDLWQRATALPFYYS